MKIKLIQNGKMPTRGTIGSSCIDCYARDLELIKTTYNTWQIKYYLGFAVQLEDNQSLDVIPRSSICKKALRLSNAKGEVDSDFRNEITAVFDVVGDVAKEINIFYEALLQLDDLEFYKYLLEVEKSYNNNTSTDKIIKKDKHINAITIIKYSLSKNITDDTPQDQHIIPYESIYLINERCCQAKLVQNIPFDTQIIHNIKQTNRGSYGSTGNN